MSEDSSSSNVNPKPVRKLPKGMTNDAGDTTTKVKVRTRVRDIATCTGPVFKMSEYDRIHDKLSTAHLKHLCAICFALISYYQ